MSAVTPLVAVLLGTDHHPFDRLVRWAADESRRGGLRWFVQYGDTEPPALLPSARMLTAEGLDGLLRDAAAVVCHGGPGLIMEARAAGHLPVVLARDPSYGEHVDDHQLRFSSRLAAAGMIRLAGSPGELGDAVARAVADPRRRAQRSGPTGFADRFGALVDRLTPST